MQSILIVDDDRELRENLSEVLNDEGFAVTAAADGRAAVELVKSRDFDLVLLDMVMPGLSGLEALLLIQQQKPHIRVVMITAFSTVENAVQAMRRGAADYLTKPFRTTVLVSTIRRVLEEARFKACKTVLDTDSTFNALANPLRRKILMLLGEKGGHRRFMDLTRELGIDDHTKVNFHLKVLKENGLVDQDGQKYYGLSAEGEKVNQCLNVIIKHLTG
ncbi:response regulator [Geothermobacter hydrogeniphilus]|uniref:Response regulatory domain-containing protein n=1 Tax=Geothermobacter hydrogeniphilus TaxID=1969733 RepID=A0A1X0YCM7_9BACT|nr:response regulator [Geothermobacter hydrogeniphilus]ORJ62877.1 hypothetical protein B5V00_02130 [Geothermobacter hydrogeniphilus]